MHLGQRSLQRLCTLAQRRSGPEREGLVQRRRPAWWCGRRSNSPARCCLARLRARSNCARTYGSAADRLQAAQASYPSIKWLPPRAGGRPSTWSQPTTESSSRGDTDHRVVREEPISAAVIPFMAAGLVASFPCRHYRGYRPLAGWTPQGAELRQRAPIRESKVAGEQPNGKR